MVTVNEIAKINVICRNVKFSIDSDKVPLGHIQFGFKISASWLIFAVRQDARSCKCKVTYNIASEIINGDIEFTVIADFTRVITEDEFKSQDTAKLCAIQSAEFLTQLVADITSKMGISPIIISPETAIKMINPSAN